MIAALAAAGAAFNLLCTGQMVTYAPVDVPGDSLAASLQRLSPEYTAGRPLSYETEYRVDLSRARWCFDEYCDKSFPIHELSDAEIVFMYSPDRRGATITVNRETGAYYRRSVHAGGYTEARGECVRKPTPGLPKRKF